MNAAGLLILIGLIALIGGAGQCEPRNILRNAGFELEKAGSKLPEGWWLWESTKGSVKCGVDESVVSTGTRSLRMRSSKPAHALLVAPTMAVAEGEELAVSVSARTLGYKTGTGTGLVAFSVAYLDSGGKFLSFTRLGKPLEDGKWHKLSGTAKVPEGIRDMTFELGLRNASGTVWFDDACVIPKSMYAIRPAEGAGELPPGKSAWRLEIINREGATGTARLQVSDSGKKRASQELALDGSAVQRVNVEMDAPAPGRYDFGVTLTHTDGTALAESTVKARVAPPLVMEPLVPTHFCIEDGKPELEARVWVQAADGEAVALEVVLRSAAGEVLDSRSVRSPKRGFTDVKLSSSRAALGDYTVEAVLKGSKEHTASQSWHVINRSQAHVTVDEAGLVVADGKPFFPLGTYNSGRYDLMKKTGFTCTHAWNRMKLPPRGERTDNQLAKDYLDETGKAGMKAIGFIHVAYLERQEWDEVRRRVRMFRNHPSLLAWDQEEGVARGEVPMDRLEKLVKIVREEDPNHPFVMADAYDEITKVDRKRFFRDDLMEIGMWWYYPIPLVASDAAAALEGQDALESNLMTAPAFLTATKKPVWVGLQAYKKPRPDGRMPTNAEHRCMAYLAANHGAKGMFYYMGGSAWTMPGETNPDRPWGYLHDLVPELHEMIPVFMAPKAKDTVEAPEVMDVCLKLDAGTYTLIAVNRTDEAVDAEIGTPSLGSKQVDVLFEKREKRAASGRLSDRFGPYEVHVYRWKSGG